MTIIEIQSPKHGVFKVMVDDEDYPLVQPHKWSIRKVRDRYYATRNTYKDGGVTKVDMHRLIMGFPVGKCVDHKDGNTINNTRDNLRIATHAQNISNSMWRSNTTGFKGVWIDKRNKDVLRYIVDIHIKCKKIKGGSFLSPVDAAKRYNELAIKYHGEFAKLNEIPE